MWNYKDFRKVYIGTSDVAKLVLAGTDKVQFMLFGGDDSYLAYLIPSDCSLPPHYEEVAAFPNQLSIYDDTQLRLRITTNPNESSDLIRVFRSGGYGCAIKVPKGSMLRRFGLCNTDDVQSFALIPTKYKWSSYNCAPFGLSSDGAEVIEINDFDD